MTKEDWIQLFKEINGRAPESKEIEAAINMGTIKEGAAPLASRQETDSKEGPQVAPLAKPITAEPDQGLFEDDPSQKETSSSNPEGIGAPKSAGTSNPDPSQPNNLAQESAKPQPVKQGRFKKSPAGQGANDKQPSAPKKRPLKLVLLSLVSLLALLVLAGAGYSGWRYQSGNISGTWKLEKKVVYKSGVSQTLQKGDRNYKFSADVANRDYLTVSRSKTIYTFAYQENKKDKDQVGLFITNYFQPSLKADYWNKTIKTTYSKKAAKEMIAQSYNRFYKRINSEKTIKVSDLYYFDDDPDLQERFAYHYTYEVDGDQLTLVARDEKGKKVEELTYKKLSKSQTQAFQKKSKQVRLKFENFMKKQGRLSSKK